MPTLKFEAQADFNQVVQMKKEIAELQKQLASLNKDESPELVAKLEARMAQLNTQLKDNVQKAALAAKAAEEEAAKMKEVANSMQEYKQSLKGISTEELANSFRQTKKEAKELQNTFKELQNDEIALVQDIERFGKDGDNTEELRKNLQETRAQIEETVNLLDENHRKFIAQREEIERRNVQAIPQQQQQPQQQATTSPLTQALEDQKTKIQEVQAQFDALIKDSERYAGSASEAKAKIEELTAAFVHNKSSMTSEEQATALQNINEQIKAYQLNVVNSSASIDAARQVEIDKINQLQESITQLETQKLQAAANGDSMGVVQIQQQIDIFNEKIQEAKNGFAEFDSRCKQSASAVASLGDEMAKMQEATSVKVGFFDNVFDSLEKIKQTTSETFEKVKTSISNAFEPAKKWAQETAEKINAEMNKVGQSVGIQRLKTEASNAFDYIKQKAGGIGDALTGNGKFQQSMGDMRKAFELLPAPINQSIKSVGMMTKALWNMAMTPLGATITAIVIGLKALQTWFTKSADGQKKFAYISGYVSSVLSTLTDILMMIGEYIFKAFDSGPLKDFAKGVKDTFFTAIGAVKDVVIGLGKTLAGIWNLDGAEIKDGINQLMDGFASAGKAMVLSYTTAFKGAIGLAKTTMNAMTDEKLTKDIGDKINNMEKAAEKSAELKEKELVLTQQLGAAEQKAAQLDIEIAKSREKIYTLKGKEKLLEIENAKKLQKQKYDDLIAAKDGLAKVQTDLNALHTTSIEQLKKEREARTSVISLQAQQAASTRMLTRLGSSTENKLQTQGKNDKKKEEAINVALNNILELTEKAGEARAKLVQDIENRLIDSQIEAMEDGAEKVEAERKRQLEKELIAITKERDEKIAATLQSLRQQHEARMKLVKAQGGKDEAFNTDEAMKSQEVTSIVKKYDDIAKNIQKASVRNVLQEQQQALNDYLKAYGNAEEKRLAITKEYQKKIENAKTEGERMSLEVQLQNELQKINFADFKESINWEQVFGNIGSMSIKVLEDLKDKLRKVLNDPNLTVDQYEAVAKQIKKINDAIEDQEQKQRRFFDFQGPKMQEVKRLYKELQEAIEMANQAQEELNNSQSAYTNAKANIGTTLGAMGVNVAPQEIKASNAQEILNKAPKDSALYENLKKLFGELAKAETNLANAVSKNTKAQADKFQKESSYKNASKGTANVVELFTEGMEKVAEKMQDLPGLLGNLGVKEDDPKMQQAQAGMTAINDGIGAAKDFMSGNYVGAAMKGISAVGNAMTALGITGDSDKSLAADMERLAISNKDLENAINTLAEQMKDASVGEAAVLYKKQIENLNKQEKSTNEIMQRAAQAYKSGFKGQGSSNKRINESMTAKDWNEISRVLGYRVTSAGQFFALSSKDMAKVALDATAQYSKIKDLADDGYKDAAQYMDDYIAFEKKRAELEDEYREKLTTVSFDSLSDDFLSSISDMNHTAADFANDFENLMKNAVLKGMMSEKFDKELRTWYEKFSGYIESGQKLEEWEQGILKEEYDSMVKRATEERNKLFDTMGWSKDGYDTQEASTKGFETMSQDTANELNGRFTALQIAGESINQSVLDFSGKITEIQVINGGIRDIASDSRDILAQSLLELQSIRENTEAVVKPIKAMQADIAKVKENTNKL